MKKRFQTDSQIRRGNLHLCDKIRHTLELKGGKIEVVQRGQYGDEVVRRLDQDLMAPDGVIKGAEMIS